MDDTKLTFHSYALASTIVVGMNDMKPIPFTRDMCDAIRDGRKTVTRRCIKPRLDASARFLEMSKDPSIVATKRDGSEYPKQMKGLFYSFVQASMPEFPLVKARYQPGDILYVPEAWKCRKPPTPDDLGYEVVFRDGGIVRFHFTDKERWKKWYKYWSEKSDNQWQSPYFMPREAARLFLRVTDVRAERVQGITKEQAEAEGQPPCSGLTICGGTVGCHMCEADSSNAIEWFSKVWDGTIKPADLIYYGWEANPMVGVTEFEKLKKVR